MTWTEVAAIHRSWAGIAVVNGVPASILCNAQKAGPFPDVISEGRLVYYVNGPSKTHGAQRLLASVGSGSSVRVFQKLGMNDWRDLGAWTPASSENEKWRYVAVSFVPC